MQVTTAETIPGEIPFREASAVSHLDDADRLTEAMISYRGKQASTLFQVAFYLQAHPRAEVTPADVSEKTGIKSHRASEVLQRFVKERTDVVRKRRGVYVYYPGRGPGAVPRGATVVQQPDQLAQKTEPKRPGSHMASRPGATLWIGAHREESMAILGIKPGSFTVLEGVHTASGNQVVRRDDGQIFALTEI